MELPRPKRAMPMAQKTTVELPRPRTKMELPGRKMELPRPLLVEKTKMELPDPTRTLPTLRETALHCSAMSTASSPPPRVL